MAMLRQDVIASMGFASLGENVQISDKVSIYGIEKIAIGDNVRVDDFCVLSAGEGGIEIGKYTHIAVFTSLIGAGKITISDFCNISSRVSIYTSNDDYSGAAMTNPMVPDEYKSVTHNPVFLGKHVIVGSGSVILPGVRLEEGVAVGALSLITENCEPFGIYAGIPAKRIKDRKHNLLDIEKKFELDEVIMSGYKSR